MNTGSYDLDSYRANPMSSILIWSGKQYQGLKRVGGDIMAYPTPSP